MFVHAEVDEEPDVGDRKNLVTTEGHLVGVTARLAARGLDAVAGLSKALP